jgi:hypothetical protein
MAKTISKILGSLFILLGILGFAIPDLLGTHLSPVHNLIHIVSGIIALYFGFAGTLQGARGFCIIFGTVYLLLGLAGILFGKMGVATVAHTEHDNKLLEVIPGVLELGTMDHTVHIILGIIFLFAGFMTKSESRVSTAV